MWSFYTIVTIIATILLIISLSIVGVILSRRQNTKEFPEYQNMCPDFWSLDSSGNTICKPTNDVNTPMPNMLQLDNHVGVVKDSSNNIVSVNIDDTNWATLCEKSSWAKKYNISWDGVTNNNSC
jgi:hypothetical protein